MHSHLFEVLSQTHTSFEHSFIRVETFKTLDSHRSGSGKLRVSEVFINSVYDCRENVHELEVFLKDLLDVNVVFVGHYLLLILATFPFFGAQVLKHGFVFSKL